MSDDNIFREVDEEMRREQIAALWDKYGVYVLAGALLIVLTVGGYNINKWWQKSEAEANGQAFYQASRLIEDNKPAEALEALSKLAGETSGGYRTLADLEIAALHAKEGRKAEAVAAFDKVARSGADGTLRDFARVQAAALRLDEADRTEMSSRLDGLNTDTNPWRYSARELLGLAAFRSGNSAESEKIFSQILGDPGAPAEIRRRAETMLALLVKTSAAAGAAPEAAAKPGSATQ